MTTNIFIVSYKRDFRYLKYALRSIAKFCSGFDGVTLVVPNKDFDEALDLVRSNESKSCPISLRSGDEWPGKGMLWHMDVIMHADEWVPKSNMILHFDSDCVFTEPVTPMDYMVNGKPVLMFATFEWLIPQQENLKNWQTAIENAIGGSCEREFMRRHPAVHFREVYATAREFMRYHTDMDCSEYMKQQRNEFPQTFAEFPTLGEIAWRHFHNRYHWIDQQKEGMPPNKLHQMWSHREVTKEDQAVFEKLGLI